MAMARLSLSVIIPAYDTGQTLPSCIHTLTTSRRVPDEVIVVDDSSPDACRGLIQPGEAHVIRLEGGPRGPAFTRNRGAEAATGDILIFIDSDVAVHSDAIGKMENAFLDHPEITALFGSYDDCPHSHGFVSDYKNLMHHYIHQHGREAAFTFWTGCGAIRREIFLQFNGFNETYTRPSIEDIELGYRLRRAGHHILLDPEIQVTHLKKWTLGGVVRTDIFRRAIPWTRLIFEEGRMPSDLNLDIKARISALTCFLFIFCALAGFFYPRLWWGLPVAIGILFGINLSLYCFFFRKRGFFFLVGTFFLHMLYLFYSGAVFVLVGVPVWLRKKIGIFKRR